MLISPGSGKPACLHNRVSCRKVLKYVPGVDIALDKRKGAGWKNSLYAITAPPLYVLVSINLMKDFSSFSS